MLNSLLYATSFTIFRGEMGGGGRTVERFWRFREIKRTLNEKEKRIKQLLARTSAKSDPNVSSIAKKKRTLIGSRFDDLQTLPNYPGVGASNIEKCTVALLPNYGLIINFSLRSWRFCRASAQLSRAPPVTHPRQNRQLRRLTLCSHYTG